MVLGASRERWAGRRDAGGGPGARAGVALTLVALCAGLARLVVHGLVVEAGRALEALGVLVTAAATLHPITCRTRRVDSACPASGLATVLSPLVRDTCVPGPHLYIPVSQAPVFLSPSPRSPPHVSHPHVPCPHAPVPLSPCLHPYGPCPLVPMSLSPFPSPRSRLHPHVPCPHVPMSQVSMSPLPMYLIPMPPHASLPSSVARPLTWWALATALAVFGVGVPDTVERGRGAQHKPQELDS